MTNNTEAHEAHTIAYETLPDLCPVCHSHGMAPCYDEAGNDVPDHAGRPVAHANEAGR